MLSNLLIAVSVVLACISPITYIRSMVRGKSSPHVVTRFVVMTASVVTFLSLYASVGKIAAFIAGVFAVRSVVLFLFTLKYGTKGTSSLDYLCLVLAILGLILWRVIGNPLWALSLSITADFLGFIPTLRKTYHKPKSEAPSFYLLELILIYINAYATILATGFIVRALVFPVYIAVLCTSVLFLIYRLEIKRYLREILG